MSLTFNIAFTFAFLFFSANASGNANPVSNKEKVFHVVMVSPRGEQRLEVAFMKELEILYDGKINYTFIKPNVNNTPEMLGLPDRIRGLKPDLIFTFGTPTTLAVAGTVKNPIISDIPIVFSPVSYPVRSGIVGADPAVRKNIIGTSHIAPVQVHFEMMMKFKKFKAIGVVYNSTESQTRFMLDDLRATAKKFNVILHAEAVDLDENGVPDPKDISVKVKQVHAKGSEWLYIGPDTFMGFTHRDVTTKAAIDVGIPSFTIGEHPIRYSHATFGVVSRLEELGRFTAFKAFQVFNKKNLSFLGSDTMFNYDILINKCAMDAIKIAPSKDIEHLVTYLTLENGGCKKP
jgi:putative ABC transport system substrate-binding protein